MLYLIVVWMFLLIASSTIGLGLLSGLRVRTIERRGDRLIIAVWLGIVALAMMLLTLSLWLPLSPLLGVVGAVLLGAIVLAFQPPRQELITLLRALASWRVLFGALAVTIAVAAFMAREVTWIDTGLYHYGSIQWFARYGSVSGVTLLFGNYGFTSSWFALAAPLNSEWLEAKAIATTNGFVLLLAVYQFLLHGTRILRQTGAVSDWFMVFFLPMMIPFSRLDAISTILVSPSPDIPILVLVGVVSWCILIICSHSPSMSTVSKNTVLDDRFIPLFLAVGAVTMKLVAIPLLLITLLFYSSPEGLKLGRLIVGGAIVALLLSPLFAYNLIASGCPLYPSSLLCLNLPWSPATEEVQQAAKATHGWMSWYGSPPAGVPRWIWAFWKWLTSSVKNQLLVVLMLVGLIGFAATCMVYLIKRPKTTLAAGSYWVMATAATGIVFFMLTSPFFRFSLSYLLLFPALALALMGRAQFLARWGSRQQQSLNALSKRWGKAQYAVSALIIAVSLHSRFPDQLILPPPLRQVPVVQKRVNDIEYWSPQEPGDLCWRTPVPCAFEVKEDVVLRDAQRGIGAGFVRK